MIALHSLFPARSRRASRRGMLLLTLFALAGGPARADELRGFVYDQSGAPILNAELNVYDPVTGDKLLPTDNTDATGKYRLIVNPGAYDVLCRVKDVNRGYAPRIVRGYVVSGVSSLDFTLVPSVQVRGKVYDSRNSDPATNGINAADLNFDRVDDGSRQPALGDITSIFGTFVAYIEPGTYNVTATPDPATGLAPMRMFGVSVPTVDILQFPLVPAVTLSGTIRDDRGAPVAGATLKFDDLAIGQRIPSTRNTSAANGAYSVAITPGIYRVTVEPAVGSSYAAIRVADVDLRSNRTQDFTLAVGVAVTGRVTDRQGLPVAEADWDAILQSNGTGAATPGDNTGFDGSYRFVVAPGVYRLRVTPPASTGLDTVSFVNVSLARDTTINVDYAALGGGGGPGASPVVRFAPVQNPTHTRATLSLVLSTAVQSARIEIFDVSGKRVQELHRGALPAGARQFPWDGRRRNGEQAHTGMYFVRAELDGFEQVTRFVLLP